MLRQVFVAGGVLILLMIVPVVLFLGESSTYASRHLRISFRGTMAAAGRETAGAIVTLGACSGVAFFAYSGAQQLIWLRLLALNPAGVALATGETSAVLGLSTALAATLYSRAVRGAGFKGLATIASLLLASAIACSALAPNVGLLIGCAAAIGLSFGALYPAVNTMLGLEAPPRIKATIFGLASSLAIFGGGAGPLVGGTVTSLWGLQTGMFVVALGGVAAFFLLWFRAREPQLYPHPDV
jgi:hypothetical protein